MDCASCGRANRPNARFCAGCGAALARFDDFTAAAASPAPARRPVLANAATAFGARIDAAVAQRDGRAIDGLIAERAETLDHRTGTTFGREERLTGFHTMLSEARDPTSRHEPLAALGSSLALLHRTLSASGFSGAALGAAVYRIEELCVVETDPQGRSVRAELFAVDRLGDAVTRLYERYAERLPDGGSRAHASAIARSVATVLGPPDPDLVHPVLALDVRYADHRALGWGPAHGVVAFVRALRTLRGALRNVEAQTIELLGARPDALVVRRTVAGELAAGDRYRRRPIVLWRFGANGRVTQWEQFDGDQRAEALARFDELAAPPAPTRLFETAATAAVDRFDRAWASRDWTGVTALFAPEFRYGDRRLRMQRDLDRAAFSEFMRPLFEMEATHSSHEVLATRGERLVLIRLRYAHAEGDVGPDESAALLVIEVNARGERIALVRFDPADRVGAHAELDARYAAGEAAEYPAMWALLWDVRRALAARNWDQLSRLVAADLTAEDHRLLGWGVARSPEEYAAALRPLAEVHPDVKLRLNHLVLRAHSALFVASWTGSEAEAEFEIPVAIVFRSGPEGRIDRVHHYSLEQIGAARARFAEFATPPHGGARRIENAATRWMFETRPSRSVSETIATRGDRLALMRIRFEGSDDAVGASEIESLTVVEVDASGHRSGAVRVDTDDLDAAYAALEARYAAGEAAASPHVAETMRAFRAAFAARDWDALVALMSPDLVVDDHRLLGWETVRGAKSYVQALHSLVDLAPDTRLRLDHVEMSQRGLLWIGAWVGTREGGEYEIPWITVSEHDARGVLVRFAVYDLEQLDTARARYGELAAPAQPNTATAVFDRVRTAYEAGDWAAMRALCAPGIQIADQRRHVLVPVALDDWFTDGRDARARGIHLEMQVVLTAGDRIALERVLWRDGDGRVESRYLWFIELDEYGRIAASTSFEDDDETDAIREVETRALRVTPRSRTAGAGA